MWFTHLMVPLLTKLRQLYRVLLIWTTFSSVLPRGGEKGKHERLPTGYASHRQAYDLARPCEASNEKRMDWKHSSRAPRLCNRHGEYEVLHCITKNSQGARPGTSNPASGSTREEMGVEQPVAIFLWCVCHSPWRCPSRHFTPGVYTTTSPERPAYTGLQGTRAAAD
jgi:hypothetical protein